MVAAMSWCRFMASYNSKRQAEGFTLIEILVALSVFSVAALALLNIQGESAITTNAIRERLLAEIVAENQLIESLAAPQELIAGANAGEVDLAGQRWLWTETVSATSDTGIAQVNVAVRRADDDTILSDVTAFRGEK